MTDVAGFLPRWLGHRAEGQPGPVVDIDRAHTIGVLDKPAFDTGEGFPVAVALSYVPARRIGAGTGGVAGIYRDHAATGAFSIVREDAQEDAPARVENAAVEPGFRRGPIGQEHPGVVGIELLRSRAAPRTAHHVQTQEARPIHEPPNLPGRRNKIKKFSLTTT